MASRWDLMPLPEAHLVGIAASWWLHRRRPWPVPAPAWARRLAGGAVAGAGTALVVRAVAAAWAAQRQQPGALVTAGPYAVVRHPMYVGWALIHLGVALAAGSGWVVMTLPAAAASVHRDVRREERELAGAVGADFDRYRAAVPRYLPRRRA